MNLIKGLFAFLAALIGGFIAYLLVVGLIPGFPTPRQPLNPGANDPDGDAGVPQTDRRHVSFDVNGTAIRAWLYLPPGRTAPAPCVVMGHGLGGTKAMGLAPYAERFQAAGYAVLVFDYRCWGESDGAPRGLIWVADQLADYAAAVRYARGRPEIDPARVALWGTSFSGGHVVAGAAQDARVACIIAQCPALDGREAMEMLFRQNGLDLRIIPHAQRDLVRSWLHLSAHRIPVVGPPKSVALMTTPDAKSAFERFAPPDYANQACARIALRADKYRPIQQAANVRCPALFQICEDDDLVPNDAVEKTAEIMGQLAEVRRYPIGHFDIYQGQGFEAAVADQLAFLSQNL